MIAGRFAAFQVNVRTRHQAAIVSCVMSGCGILLWTMQCYTKTFYLRRERQESGFLSPIGDVFDYPLIVHG